MYNDNKYFCYTRRRIIETNIYCHYTRRCIMTINILLYKKTYNKIFVSIIQGDV